MGRELKRKQAKREGKNVREVQRDNMDKPLSPVTFGIIIGFILLFFVILYIITGLFITKDLKWFGDDKDSSDVEESTIVNRILAVDSLKQSEDEYYVYYYDASKDENATVGNLLSGLETKVYRVDLADSFNENFVGDKSGIVDDISNLKVSDPTVIKVSGQKMVGFYSGEEEIKGALGQGN